MNKMPGATVCEANLLYFQSGSVHGKTQRPLHGWIWPESMEKNWDKRNTMLMNYTKAPKKKRKQLGYGKNYTPFPIAGNRTTGIDKGKGPDGEGPPLSPGERTPTGTESPLRPYCKVVFG
uniref:Uncharacterized protein n=1 Tax=Oryza rufipogon TaxID=4529 RepID=A0A0E0PKA4_ORYRU